MVNKEVIRNILIKHGFEDNEYLNRYCDIILDNEFTEPKKHITNVHHVIPKHVYKSIGLDYIDTKDAKVNLSYSDHILAHYYLMMCGGEHAKRNEKAIKVLTSGTRGSMSILEAVEHREELQKIFTEHMVEVSNKIALEKLKNHQDKLGV